MEQEINETLQKGIVKHNAGNLKEAERLYRIILKTYPNHPEANHNLGAIAFSIKKTEIALLLFEIALKANPNIEQFWISYINALIKEKQYKKAKQFLEKGKKQLLTKDKVKALSKQLDLAINNQSPSYTQLNNILNYYNNKQYQDAEQLAISITKKFPSHSFSYKMLGNLFKLSGKMTEALTACQMAVEIDQNDAPAHFNLANILVELDRLDEAEASLDIALILDPHFKPALLQRGQILFDKGNVESSLRDFDLCNTFDSRARSLISLYALGRIKDIYKRVEKLSKIDDGNIRMAAFTSFIAEKNKKETAHNFCKNPMECIHYSNICSHIEDTNLFIIELIAELKNIKTNWEPFEAATRKGFQSYINLFINPKEKMNDLKSLIMNELNTYYLKFKNENCSYIKKWPHDKNLYGWHVILKQQGYQNAHIHTGGWLSGVIYLKVVPSFGKNEGAIEFNLSGSHYSDINSTKITYQPQLGDIIFFPSSLHHRTIPFTTDTDRIIISFDLMPKN